MKPFLLSGVSLLVMAASAMADEAESHFRVFVGDHAAPRITAFDLEAPETRWTFDVRGQAKLYPVAGGAVVAAVQSDVDRVDFIASGITLSDHGDHADIEVTDPAALATGIDAPRPFHVVAHGGVTAINHDKGGYADLLDDAALAEGRVAPVRFDQSFAHHGFVVKHGDLLFSTVSSTEPGTDGAAPPRLGLQAFQPDGTPVGDLAICTAIHGEAFSGAYLAAGCREGVLTARAGADGPAYGMLPYPADFPAGTTGTLLGSTGMQLFLGNHGADGLVVIDPMDAPHMKRIALPFRRVDFVLDPVRLNAGYALTEDGTLHRIDLLAANVNGSSRVVEPYSMDGHWSDPRPRLAMAGDEILLTDPRAGAVLRISAETLTETGRVDLGGMPYNLTVVGGSGVHH